MSLQQGPGPSRPRRPQLPGRAERPPRRALVFGESLPIRLLSCPDNSTAKAGPRAAGSKSGSCLPRSLRGPRGERTAARGGLSRAGARRPRRPAAPRPLDSPGGGSARTTNHPLRFVRLFPSAQWGPSNVKAF